MTAPVMAATAWKNNAELIADVARLGYLRTEWLTLDCTWGLGRWWTIWRPDRLVMSDLCKPGERGRATYADFTRLPYRDSTFAAVAYDPPYKLNGTPTASVDGQYGVDVVRTWQQRMDLCRHGIRECARVLKLKGILLVKCQDQVSSGEVRWQTDNFSAFAWMHGLYKEDRFDLLTASRPQPERTRLDGKPSVQQHARRNYSTLLVFRRVS